METPTIILFVLGCLGGADILLFHSVAHGIRSHPDSAKELITHSLRGPTYAALFVLIPNFQLRGWFAWGLLALFVFDVGISIADFALEQNSRRVLGGLPGGEYVLHMLMAMVFGALVTTVIHESAGTLLAPTRLLYAPAAVPAVLRMTLLVMAVLVLVSGVQDAIAAYRLTKDEQRQTVAATTAQHFEGTPILKLEVEKAGGILHECRRSKMLMAAGVYNLVWGLWVVLFPNVFFCWVGVTPPNYPELWQCIGMIVGVYGVGYLIAARDPVRHWPIVLVGLLGKVFGPIGMVWSVTRGSLPAIMAWACLPNDLIWWVPFALLLKAAWVQRAVRAPTQRGPRVRGQSDGLRIVDENEQRRQDLSGSS
jgi:hypothetical protein